MDKKLHAGRPREREPRRTDIRSGGEHHPAPYSIQPRIGGAPLPQVPSSHQGTAYRQSGVLDIRGKITEGLPPRNQRGDDRLEGRPIILPLAENGDILTGPSPFIRTAPARPNFNRPIEYPLQHVSHDADRRHGDIHQGIARTGIEVRRRSPGIQEDQQTSQAAITNKPPNFQSFPSSSVQLRASLTGLLLKRETLASAKAWS